MKTKFGIVGCGFLGGIVANAWKNGLLPDYELVGVTSRTRASAEKLAAEVGCPVCDDVDALLTLQPEYIVETASVEAVRAWLCLVGDCFGGGCARHGCACTEKRRESGHYFHWCLCGP